MNCNEVQKSLVYFLEGEIAAAEAQRIRQHVSECEACRRELATLTSVRYNIAQALQSRARQVQPSSEAWSNLEARLAKEARPSPTKLSVWITRLAPGGIAAATPLLQGENRMRTRTIVTAVTAVAALAVFAIFMVKNVTPVSAQQILERAYDVQSVSSSQGIQHISVESSYTTYNTEKEPTLIKTLLENYYDYQTGNHRSVISNIDTGEVMDAYAYDGNYSYSGTRAENAEGPLTIYRVPQPREKISQQDRPTSFVEPTRKMFEDALKNPDLKIIGKEPWSDNQTAYILSFNQPTKMVMDNYVVQISGTVTMSFDADTYQLLETKHTFQKDGKEELASLQKYLVDEMLPMDTQVAWDLSDLNGVTIVDDPNGEKGDMLPEIITPQELATHTQGFLLDAIPEGFTLEITAPPRQENESVYIYIASYRNEADDYFVIQTVGNRAEVLFMESEYTETYKTASGLEIKYRMDEDLPGDRQITSALVTTPDDIVYGINSTLPLEQFKALLEHLELIQK
jgi:hypothetical protein